jgi:glycosyltransferase involved in cell wall biosynthesis
MDVSYLITIFNKQNEIHETISCIQNQEKISSLNIEIVCIDDLSTDRSIQILEKLKKKDDRIKVIKNNANLGPSKSINIAAKNAKGKYLIPIDGDDFLPADATRYLLDNAKKYDSELVFGISKRLKKIPDRVTYISPENFHNKPLEHVLKKPIVRMGYLVSKNLWMISEGADEKVFIQDMSLPLRLAANTESLVFLNSIIYYLRDTSNTNLSDNTNQQHHDRYFTYLNFLSDYKKILLDRKLNSYIHSKLISSIWKIKRDNSRFPIFSINFFMYAANKIFKYNLNKKDIIKWSDFFINIRNIRRSI